MNPPYWIRAAVAVSLLADELDDFEGYGPAGCALATAHAARLRAGRSRAEVARAVVGEVLRAERPDAVGGYDTAGAETLLARWLRGLDREHRARVLAAWPLDTARRLAQRAPGSPPWSGDAQPTATWMVTTARRTLDRWATLDEWAELLEDLRDARPASSPSALRLERSVRIAGRRDACARLAREVARA